MTRYLYDYIESIRETLKLDKKKTDWEIIRKNHLIQIEFLQHERLIHLLVTLFFGLLFFITMVFTLGFVFLGLVIIDVVLLVLIVPYVWHYFCLENGVQKLYEIDKVLQSKISGGRG